MLTPDPQLQQIREAFASVGVELEDVSLHEGFATTVVGLGLSLADCLRVLRALEVDHLLGQEERLGRCWAVLTPARDGGEWSVGSALDGTPLPGQLTPMVATGEELAVALRTAAQTADADVLGHG